jgi:ribosomal protein L35AE/L33A
MHDPETHEARTAVVTIPKRALWQTAEGRVVHGVVVRWEGGGG